MIADTMTGTIPRRSRWIPWLFIAGFGVVDPMGMLLATSLMLAEGLNRRSASQTLERAVGRAADSGRSDTTREFTDAVIELLPQSRTDVDHFDEVWR